MSGRRMRVVVFVAIAAVVLFGATAAASNFHTSSTYTNNGCSWKGGHSWYDVNPPYFTVAEGQSWTGETVQYSCSQVSVRMRYDIWTTSYAYHWDWASVYRQIPGPLFNFHWSDHNADPPGSPPWVGFRLY